jgi:hypothetical protein
VSAHPELIRATHGPARAAPLGGPWPLPHHRTLAEALADGVDPYHAGWDALRAGRDLAACPHEGAARLRWIRGWTDCALDLAGERR